MTHGVYVKTAAALYGFAMQARRDLGMCSVYGLLFYGGVKIMLFVVPKTAAAHIAANDDKG